MNELVFGERRYRRIGEKMIGQNYPPVLTGVWEMAWRHVGFRPVLNWALCRMLDTGADPWLHGFAPNNASTPTAGTSRQNKRSKSKASSAKVAGSPSGG